MSQIKKSIRWIITFCLKALLRLNFKIIIQGEENIPQTRSALIVANHASYLDVLILGLIFHENLNRVRWIISKQNYRLWFLKWLYAIYPVIVVNGTVEKAKKALQEGNWVVIFPEGAAKWCAIGSKEPPVKKRYTGTAAIALSTQADIIPVHIHGAEKVLSPASFKLQREHTITTRVGKPYSFKVMEEKDINPEILEQKTAEIINSIYES